MEVNREFDFKQDWKFYFNLHNVILGRNSFLRFYFVSFCKLWSVLWKTFHKPIRKHLWQILFFIKFLYFNLGIFQSFLLNFEERFFTEHLKWVFLSVINLQGKISWKVLFPFCVTNLPKIMRKKTMKNALKNIVRNDSDFLFSSFFGIFHTNWQEYVKKHFKRYCKFSRAISVMASYFSQVAEYKSDVN